MIYQRQIPRDELFAAQLEMLMQNSRVAILSVHLAGVFTTVLIFWPFLELPYLLMWVSFFVIFLLANSLYMSNSLVEHRYRSNPRRTYRQLIITAALTGAVWSAVFIYTATLVPVAMQYIFLIVIVIIAAMYLAVTGAVQEYFVVYLFASVWPVAWWSLVHYWQQPYNLVIGLFLLLICAILLSAGNRMSEAFRNMISMGWERETISQELADLTGSLRDRNRQLRQARRQLTDLANVDELTGLGNRRLVNSVLRDEINRARRGNTPLSVIMLDVDFFKNYNDSYGHPAGDVVLQLLADVMQRATSRAGELVARYGGEEFILVLPGASSLTGMRTAMRLRELVNEENIVHDSSGVGDHITVSQGLVTVFPEADLEPNMLIEMADQALYKAKNSGRDAIEVAGVGATDASAPGIFEDDGNG